ncbi:MAG: amidohydrolase [Bacteroidales bacterium]|nr:amidohydrolase [Bacteroidales bacterium]
MIVSCNSPKESADFILFNARIYTVDSAFSMATALAVKDGRFLSVGSDEEILSRFSSENKLDAQQKPVFPAFMDGHCHFLGMGENRLRYADLNNCRSFDEVLQRLQQHAKDHPSEWILGRGWDQNLWQTTTFPTNEALNQLFPNQKVALTRIDGHAGLVSDAVLQWVGFNEKTTIKGGIIMKDVQGKPTGIVLDKAYEIIQNKIPPLTRSEKEAALLEAQKICFAAGLSGVTDAGLDLNDILLIDSMQKHNLLKIKCNIMMNSDEATMNYFMEKGAIHQERLSVRSVKLYADGALGSRGAKLLEPYSDAPTTTGLMVAENEDYLRICQKAYEADFQVCTHAIGDAAVRTMLQLYASVLQGKNDCRWRIEHAQVVHPDDFVLFSQFSIIPSIQSTHATSDMFWADKRLGTERLKSAYAQRQLLQQNGWLINGTDFPIEKVNPLHTFYAAVARQNEWEQPPSGFQTENALTREEALRSITIWVAKGYFEEQRKGSIEKGKEADFVILSEDLMTTELSKILSAKVLHLFVSGEEVFSH